MMFAILFNSLFIGQLGFCNRVTDKSVSYLKIHKDNCTGGNEKQWGPDAFWTNYDVNYDDIIQSMISLFILSTLEGWPE